MRKPYVQRNMYVRFRFFEFPALSPPACRLVSTPRTRSTLAANTRSVRHSRLRANASANAGRDRAALLRTLARALSGFRRARARGNSDVLHAWQGLGYYARARNSRRLLARCRKISPARCRDATEIATLPGVGRYTAGAVASFAFDRAEPIVDANIARVLSRLTNWQQPIDTTAGQANSGKLPLRCCPSAAAVCINSALMELGALVCLPRRPLCGQCPVRAFCAATNPAELPRKKPKPRVVRLHEPHVFPAARDRILLEQSHARWRGMWILPRLAARLRMSRCSSCDFPFTHHRVTLAVFATAEPVLPNENLRWFSRARFDRSAAALAASPCARPAPAETKTLPHFFLPPNFHVPMTPPLATLPDARGHFGPYGGMFVPETLMSALEELTAEYETRQKIPIFRPNSTICCAISPAGRRRFISPSA